MKSTAVGIIGGSGVYNAEMLEDARTVEVDTPFGSPSGPITLGSVDGTEVAFLPRHGIGHTISPGELNSRANVFALKKLNVSHIISASAVGSLKDAIKPLDAVVPDQIFDRTKARHSTFFEDGIVVHVSFADPFCHSLSALLVEVMNKKGYTVHPKGTYVCMEGPQFSTRAESNAYRSMGFDIIGMTALPEAKLAREAEICYAMLATVTDYDCWRDEEVDIGTVISNVKKNEKMLRDVIMTAVPMVKDIQECTCHTALQYAVTTDREMIPEHTRKKLDLLLGKYL